MLCREWVDWQLHTYPNEREKIARKFQSGEYAKTVATLETIHAAPGGAILLAKLDGRTVGCVMYDRVEPRLAEIQRLFVTEVGRGHGVGRALLEGMFTQMQSSGYTRAMLSSARFLTHARQLYEQMGFVEIERPQGVPDYVYFMERCL